MRPDITQIAGHYRDYINSITEDDPVSAFEHHSREAIDFFNSITEEQSTFKYAENKWTLKEVLQHVIDAERVFNFRALSLARGENTPLPPFDENDFAANSHANDRSWKSLAEEFAAVRSSSMAQVKSFNESDLPRTGIVSGKRISVVAILYITVGHVMHHLDVIKSKYLVH